MTQPLVFLFAGGGTGGHLFPGIAVAEELKRRSESTRIVFAGSGRAIESTIVAGNAIEHHSFPVQPLPILRRNPIRFFWQNWQALKSARKLIDELRPNVVIGLGGFASAPAVLAASRQRIPIVLLEQNVIAGRATRWLSRFSITVCTSFSETRPKLKCPRVIVTGSPVRKEIASLYEADAADRCSRATPELLILGGSQGANSLNEAVLEAVRQIRDALAGWHFVHQTGPHQADTVRNAYAELGLSATVQPFFHELAQHYSRATLAISRSGAGTLAELACAGIPAILMPFPNAAHDHQTANAERFVQQQAAVLVKHSSDSTATAVELATVISTLIENPARRSQMSVGMRQLAHPNAVGLIAETILDCAQDSSTRPENRD